MRRHAMNLGNALWSGPVGPLRYPEVPITGAITLGSSAWNRMHVCTGTSADYTVTMPACAGHQGDMIGLRMSPALTKFVTFDGNASELTDGALTRVMWTGETALLLCDGANLFKIAGKTLPLFAQGERTTAVSLTASTITQVPLTVVNQESLTGLVDTGGSPAGVIRIKRTGRYVIEGFVSMEIIGTVVLGALVYCILGINSVTAVSSAPSALSVVPTAAEGANTVSHVPMTAPRVLTQGDYVSLMTFQGAGVTAQTRTATGFAPHLSVLEVPSW